jgi:hypothetical protein
MDQLIQVQACPSENDDLHRLEQYSPQNDKDFTTLLFSAILKEGPPPGRQISLTGFVSPKSQLS